jgi:hypothetical protein
MVRMHVAIFAVLLCACRHGGYGGGGTGPGTPAVQLEPNDTRPLFSIEVGDEIEAALLQQRLRLEPLRLDGKRLFFHDAGDIRAQLAVFGYEPVQADPYRVYQRVVRVRKRGDEAALRRAGVTLINREPEAWIVRGDLGTLRGLVAAGYVITPIASNEPRPRYIRVYVGTPAQAQEVGRIVSIYASGRAGDQDRGLLLAAAAFDADIDALLAAGYRVERIDPDSTEGRP